MSRLICTSLLCSLVVAGLVGSACANDGERYTLKYQFKPDERVYFLVNNSSERRFLHSEQEVRTSDTVEALKHYRVLSVTAEGGAVLELTIDRTRMSAEQANVLYRYDSTTDRNPPEAFASVHGTVGRPWLHVEVNNLGEPGRHMTPGGTPLQASSDFVSRVLPLLPSQPVAIGETWREQFVIELPEGDIMIEEGKPLLKPIQMQRIYKLESVKDGVATIALRTEVLTTRRSPRQDLALSQRKFQGTIRFDISRGLLLGRDLKLNETVVGHDGPQTATTVKMIVKDDFAPNGLETPYSGQAAAAGTPQSAKN